MSWVRNTSNIKLMKAWGIQEQVVLSMYCRPSLFSKNCWGSGWISSYVYNVSQEDGPGHDARDISKLTQPRAAQQVKRGGTTTASLRVED